MLLKAEVAALCPFAVIACVYACLNLLFAHFVKLFLSAEAGIGKALSDKVLRESGIDFFSQALLVGAVCAFFAVLPRHALHRDNAVLGKT